ncbi:MAG: PKD domain-containing protein [Candidatus Cloacimonetes bacterium]|nr:PKD domain-containing protein [Candidatus Cloacimonadota bacterium]MDY0173199.1 PKD domain-containing protein [Candidatus Cloacimonadaceae bacterium]
MKNRTKHLWFSLFIILVVSFAQAQQTATPTGVNFRDRDMLTVYPSFIEFGNVGVGSVGMDEITISSSPAATMTLTSLTIGDSASCTISNMPTLPYAVVHPDELVLAIEFAPLTIGEFEGTVELSFELGYSRQVYLHGFGVEPPPPMIALPTTPYDFGEVPVYSYDLSTSIDVSLTPEWLALHTTGDIYGIYLTAQEQYPSFSLGAITNTTTSQTFSLPLVAPIALNATDELSIEVNCSPADMGEVASELSITCEDGVTHTMYVTATGVMPGARIELSPDNITINVVAGESNTGGFYIKNFGDEELYFEIDDYGMPFFISFSVMEGEVNIGDSLFVSVEADASELDAGRYNYGYLISSNDVWVDSPYLTVNVNVSNPPQPLAADFHADFTSGHPPFMVSFSDDSHGDSTQPWSTINSWKWDFNNDGVFDAFVQNPSYTYTAPGAYSVRLVIGTNTGATASKLITNYINGTNSAPQIADPLNTINMWEDTTWGPEYVYDIFNDADGDTLAISCQGSQHLTATVTENIFLTITPAPDWYGVETISIKATDPFGESVTHNVLVTVNDMNDAPVLSIPSDLYFIRNSVYTVDFAPYISDPDNPHSELSLVITALDSQGDINFVYNPINTADIQGQFKVDFSSLSQVATSASFHIAVNDNVLRLISSANFTMHVIEHFAPALAVGAAYEFAGQTVVFTDATVGNPDHWLWEFGNGDTSTLQNPQYQYLGAGTYDVRLTLGNSQVPSEDTHVFMPGLINLSGTAVTVGDVQPIWTPAGSPYNLFGDVVIDGSVEIQDEVVVNLFSEEPLQILGAISANGVRFQSQAAGGKWGGLKFSGSGLRNPSILTDCEIIDALLPVDISTQSPVFTNLTIAVSDTTIIADGEAIRLFESSCQIAGAEILNYRGGIVVDGQSPNRATPTLSNIRVRNASNTQRTLGEATTGVTLKSPAVVNNLEVDNCSIGILIGTESATISSTPTLTNIRVRNSSNTQRSVLEGIGIKITGNAAPNLSGVNVSEVANGIVIDSVISSERATPTLTNIRVRNASNTQRSLTNGLIIRNTPTVIIEDAWFDDFANGISIEADSRAMSTPTLTNIRVRNASNTQRSEATGIKITGSVNASLTDVEIEDYTNGLNYDMTGSTRAAVTVTLSNIRVRNASNTQRQLSTGAVFSGLGDLRISDMEIDDFAMGLMITASDTRAMSTPTLTNIRVRNASNTQREGSTGIFLGSGLLGSMEDCLVEEHGIGIMLADGNQTVLRNNHIFNCKTGLRAAGLNPLPLSKQLFVVEDAYLAQHPGLDFTAFELTGTGPWSIAQNTIYGYKKGVKATNANVNFHSNILWTTGQELTPFVNQSSYIQNSYNDIYRPAGVHPGTGNINSDPMFLEPSEREFRYSYNSPCIDAGNPALALDPDESRADMGFFCYLHRASASPSARFVVVGTEVDFTNTSWGHDYTFTQKAWYLGDSANPAGTGQNFSYVFETPGVYDLRLRMQSGNLIDEKVYLGMVVVSSDLLLAPENPALIKSGNDIVFTWDAVTQTVSGDPFTVPYYIVYKADSPDGFYKYKGNLSSPVTSFTDPGAALEDKAFYLVIGFTGTRAELLRFIETTPQISRTGARQ